MQITYSDRFWMKSWDDGLKDLDPSEWETTNLKAIQPSFDDFPNKIALEFLGKEISYRELDEFSNQFANMLIDNGFKVGDIVGISLANCPQYVISILGTMKAGCVVSGVSPLLSASQIQYQLNDLGIGGKNVALVTLDAIFENHLLKIKDELPQLKLIIGTNLLDMINPVKQFIAKFLDKVPKGNIIELNDKKVIIFKDILKNYSKERPKIQISPDDLAYVQYTGGTTGPPKGAMLTHRSTVADILIVQEWLGWKKNRGQDTALSGFPFFHIAGLFFCMNALFLGWTQILIPNPRDTDFICEKMKKYKPNYLVNVPSLFQMLLKNPKFKELDHSKMKRCITAASPFPKESQEQLEKIVGKGILLECYGMTETSPLTTFNPDKGVKKLGSIGIPLLNTYIKLIKPETGEEVGIGEPGEICVKGPQVMKGYLNKPKETNKAIDSEGYMHTGDVAVFDADGYLRIVDRTKDMIIVGGYKVFSKKTEEILSNHPAIDMIAIIGTPNKERPGSEIVKAYITLDPNYNFEGDKDTLKKNILEYARERCAPYEVPKSIIIRETLPLTTVGKIDKKILRKE